MEVYYNSRDILKADTARLQLLEHLWNHETMFETGVVLVNDSKYSARTESIKGVIFSSFSNIKVCRVFSLESPHRGDSNEYIQHTVSR